MILYLSKTLNPLLLSYFKPFEHLNNYSLLFPKLRYTYEFKCYRNTVLLSCHVFHFPLCLLIEHEAD